MNKYLKIYTVCFVLLALNGCQNFEEINKNPNAPGSVRPNNLLNAVIFEPINANINMQFKFIGQVMQYMVYRNENAIDVYNFGAAQQLMSTVWQKNYQALKNSKDMMVLAKEDKGYQAAGLIMDAFHLAVLTEIWGSIPLSQAVLGDENITPSYDSQELVFMRILDNLKQANTLLASPDEDKFKFGPDILFGGDVLRWRKMANSLRLRYLLRLSDAGKYPNAQRDFEEIVGDSEKYPIITSNTDHAVYDFLGVAPNTSNFSMLSKSAKNAISLSKRFCTKLSGKDTVLIPKDGHPNPTADDDPRLDFFAIKGDKNEGTKGFVGAISGDTEVHAKSTAGDPNEHGALPTDRFLDNRGSLDFGYITFSELSFILAEAKLKGWNVPKSTEDYYTQAIEAVFAYWGLSVPTGFMSRDDVRLDGVGSSPNQRLERLLEQKWLSGYGVNIFDSWADYKRTGKPVLTMGPQVAGRGFTVAPYRMLYPILESQVNEANYQSASQQYGGSIQEKITSKLWYQP